MDWYTLRQLWVECGICMHSLSIGMVLAYTSCLLPGLRAKDSAINVDMDTASWLASLVSVTAPVTLFFTAYLMDRFGRRKVLLLIGSLDIFGWLIIYGSKSVSTLMFGRFLSGLSTVSAYVLIPTICAEYCAPKYRGVFTTFKSMSQVIGYLGVHVLSHYFSWRDVALFAVIPGVIALVCNSSWPESPSWLLSKNRFEECEETFYWLRGKSEKATKELQSMVEAQKERISIKSEKVSRKHKVVMFLRKFKQASFLKPLFITIFAALLKESSGKTFFAAYATDIMSQIFKDKSYQYLYIIGIDLLTISSIVVSCFLIRIMGRKTLLMVSGIPSCFFLLSASLLLFLTSKSFIPEQPRLIPALVCLYFIFANIGCCPIPFIIISEVYSLPDRESGVALSGNAMSLTMFLVMKLTPFMLEYLKLHGTLLVLAACMIVSLAYLHFALPETRNRTLQEIEDYFVHGSFSDDRDIKEEYDEATKVMLKTTDTLECQTLRRECLPTRERMISTQ